jgi:RNA polymerase Rpb1, domain 4
MAFITQHIVEHKQNVADIIEDAYHDHLKAAPGMTLRESFDSRVERELDLARDTPGQYAQKNLKEDNNVKQMVVVGSKGSFINISQMSVCVGQQSLEDRRISFGFRHRSLPHLRRTISAQRRGVSWRICIFIHCAHVAASRRHCDISRQFVPKSPSSWRGRKWETESKENQIYQERLCKATSRPKSGGSCLWILLWPTSSIWMPLWTLIQPSEKLWQL